ncbi:MAG: PTS sugar transporter subunit IIA [Acidiphilium sp.]|uniref:PTS sugar transporter subunit IIA n=1 Tax=Acidiphilium acidophilum TaxID=76588 RepID=A0AAW9DS20_ACIAO|nr:PTS sugar transporter subunit IIA [Acidiphilium acidophilum]MDD2862018.1 PTS sugar transporter subunit IIA [Acidiphilium sp.]MDX5931143.1 PTS sugar transporter subunit IIA [Acidiphilium acidophilum]MEE3501929.1 PTS sugar transporter subunit IIA [Acidiphilium acidophilum]GBQ21860.1 PTS system transporter subunit IIA [Acidiphilium acidophilum DSM 700]
MIGLVLVSHGNLGVALREAMEHVVGPQRNVATVSVEADADIETQRREIAERVAEVDTGDGVVVLTDMFGGTPCNLSMSMLNRSNVEVIAGVNLPMLVKLAKIRGSHTLVDAVHIAEAAGRKYIACGSEVVHPITPRRACG